MNPLTTMYHAFVLLGKFREPGKNGEQRNIYPPVLNIDSSSLSLYFRVYNTCRESSCAFQVQHIAEKSSAFHDCVVRP